MPDVLSAAEPAARLLVQAAAASLVPGLLLAAAAALGLRHARVSAAARHAVWFAALLLVAAMPVASALLSGDAGIRRVDVEPAGRVNAVRVMSSPASTQRKDGSGDAITSPLVAAPMRPTVTLPGGRWVVLPFVIILAGIAFGFAQLMLSMLAVRRLVRTSTELSADDERTVRGLVAADGRASDVSVRLTDQLRTPATVGLVGPAILLPADVMRELPGDELRAVLLHEMEHVRRGDLWWNLGQRLAVAAMWWHPAARWMSRRLELEREMACDEAVVRALGRPLAYARSLTRLAELARAARVPVLATAAAPRAGHLARRVEALVAHGRTARLSPSRKRLAATLILTPVAGAALVAFSPSIALTDRSVSRALAASAGDAKRFVSMDFHTSQVPPSAPSGEPRIDRAARASTSRSVEASIRPSDVHRPADVLPELRPDASPVVLSTPVTVGRVAISEAPARAAESGDAAEAKGRGSLDPVESPRPSRSKTHGSVLAAFTGRGGPGDMSGRGLGDVAGVAWTSGRALRPALPVAYPRPRFGGGGW